MNFLFFSWWEGEGGVTGKESGPVLDQRAITK